MGRKLSITVRKATGLNNADADEGGISDPFVIVCFDNKVDQELGRTDPAPDTTDPVWNHTFDVDVSDHIKSAVEATGEEPKMITFCVYDHDAGEAEPLGVAGVAFGDLVKTGKWEGETPVYMGRGSVDVEVTMKKAKMTSMLKDNAAVIGGGALGAAAVGGLGYYLFNRYKKKKTAEEENEVEEGSARAGGMQYGYNVDDDDDDEEERDTMKKWWEMDDEDDDEEEENRWSFQRD